jgi:hypothetical protein
LGVIQWIIAFGLWLSHLLVFRFAVGFLLAATSMSLGFVLRGFSMFTR